MFGTILTLVATAVALYVAVYLVPQISFDGDWVQLLIPAAIFGVVNAIVRPVISILALPVTILTLGLAGFVINAAMLLLTAWVSDQFAAAFTVGGFPPNLDSDAIVGAVLGSIVISVVMTAFGLLNRGRRIVT